MAYPLMEERHSLMVNLPQISTKALLLAEIGRDVYSTNLLTSVIQKNI